MFFMKKIFSILLCFSIILSGFSIVSASDTGTDVIPGTKRTVEEYNAEFLSVTGFAKGQVNDRSKYIGTDAYVIADDEVTFLKAIDAASKGEVKVIEVTNDLDLGYKHLSDEAKACKCLSDYEGNISVALTSPAIMYSGVSQLSLSGIKGLTIFSKSGAAIKRAEWKLQQSSSDIVIRNIKFDGMWQWTSSTKDAGWSCMKVNGAKGVWMDHCTFTMGVDGNCDLENGASGISFTWCKFGAATDSEPDQDSNIYQTMSYMEYLYENNRLSSDDIYYRIRKNGTSFKDLLAYTGWHHKAFLIGSGDKDYKDNERLELEDGNQRLEVTFAYSHMENLGSRVVRMRQGRAHMFNCYQDNMAHHKLAKENSTLALASFGINRCIDNNNGGSVAADTCVYYGVNEVIKGSERISDSVTYSDGWSFKFQKAYNHTLVVNSKVTTVDGKTYTGSSWDNNGDNLFNAGFSWYDKSTIGKFAWVSKIVDVDKMERENPPSEQFKFEYDYEYELPYSYRIVDLDSVKNTVLENAGAYSYSEDENFWLRTEYSSSESFSASNKIVEVTGFSTNFESVKIDLDDTIQLLAEIEPSNASDRKISFISSNTEVAEITDSGLIIPKAVGKTEITVSSENGVKKTVNIDVYVKVSSVSLNAKSKTIYTGTDFQMIAECKPENASDKSVTWTSSDEKIATVDDNGVVHPISVGKVNIICTSVDNPSKNATCRFTVKEGTASPSEISYLKGDVDANGIIEAADALEVLKIAAKIKLADEIALQTADVNADNNIDAADALDILMYVAKLIDSFS